MEGFMGFSRGEESPETPWRKYREMQLNCCTSSEGEKAAFAASIRNFAVICEGEGSCRKSADRRFEGHNKFLKKRESVDLAFAEAGAKGERKNGGAGPVFCESTGGHAAPSSRVSGVSELRDFSSGKGRAGSNAWSREMLADFQKRVGESRPESDVVSRRVARPLLGRAGLLRLAKEAGFHNCRPDCPDTKHQHHQRWLEAHG